MSGRKRIEDIINAAFEPVVVFKQFSNEVIDFNDEAAALFHISAYPKDQIILRHFCSRADLFNEQAALRLFKNLKENKAVLYDWPVRLGRSHWLSAYLKLITIDNQNYILASFRDNTDATESLIKLDNMVSYREMLEQLLAYSSNVDIKDIPSIIDQALDQVGNFFNCDRSYVFEYTPDLKFKTNINEWCAKGIESYIDTLQNIPTASYSYLQKYLFNMEVVRLDDVNDLPDDAIQEREEFAKEGIQSILLIPFSEGNRPIGFVGLDHVRAQKQWSTDEVSNLKLLARTFANLIIRNRSEQRYLDHQNMYQTLFESANNGIGIIRNGILIDTNEKGAQEFRCTKEQLIGLSTVEMSATQQPNGKSPAYSKVYISEALKGKPQIFDWRLKRLDGTEFDAELTLNRFYNNGEPLIIAIFRDVSSHKQTLRTLIDHQTLFHEKIHSLVTPTEEKQEIELLDVFELNQLQRLQNAFSFATGISSLITNTQGVPVTKMSFSNKICARVRSTPKGQKMCMESSMHLGKAAKEAAKPVSKPCLSCGFIDAAAPIIVDGIHIGNWLIGQVRPENVDVSKLLNYTRKLGLSDDEIEEELSGIQEISPSKFEKILNLLNVLTIELSSLGYNNLKLAKTVHKHVNLERKLRQSKQEAEESDRLKSAFLANLSHEIRTPMNGIVGFSELLLQEGLTPDDRREYVRLIHQSSSQLLSIINDIIDISKIESGQIDIHPRYFDIVQLGADLESFFIDSANNRNIELVFANKEASEQEIFSDEVKLRQVLTNLLSNAIKFTPKGKVEFGYEAAANNRLHVYVQDTGIGIDKEDLEFIFDRFWQAKDRDIKKGGTGLGLAITRAYVELLGGHIEVYSKRDKGTRFSFTIPAHLS
jgi:PAS domain S-box-containing protein